MHKRKNQERIKNVIFYLVLLIVVLMVILPFAWMFSTSFKGNEAIRTIPIRWIPQKPTFDNYKKIFNMSSYNFWQAGFNSFYLAITCTIVSVLSATMAAFVFSKIEFRGRDKLFLLYLATMMIPATVTMIPNYTILNHLHLLDTFTGLILMSLNNTFGVFLMRQAMMGVSNAYIEAAFMDGASLQKIFIKIMLPMTKPTLFTLILMNFMGSWNSYLQPLLVLSSNNKQTLQLVLATLNGQLKGKENITMAGAVISILPIVIVYVMVQKYIDQGLEVGGIKG
ncbi:MAG: multiple sugar transport system permease protein [Clostridiales bacterium]|nr:multiple sugar transport system permease protein [Clostridiales bacterium]